MSLCESLVHGGSAEDNWNSSDSGDSGTTPSIEIEFCNSESRSVVSRHTNPCRAPAAPARLLRERTPGSVRVRSTPTRTARSCLPPVPLTPAANRDCSRVCYPLLRGCRRRKRHGNRRGPTPVCTPIGRCSECITLRLLTTVEIACLKINCSWLLFSSSTEYLSKDRIFPVSLTPLTR